MSDGIVVWITGLSGAGKSTISKRVAALLRQRGDSCVLLDGDEVRRAFPIFHAGYDRASRLPHARRNSELAKLISEQGHIVVLATMSLFSEVQEWNRANFPAYLEVFVDVPLAVLKARDHNGLYPCAEQGLAKNVAGIDLAYDALVRPDLVVDNSGDISKIEDIALAIAN